MRIVAAAVLLAAPAPLFAAVTAAELAQSRCQADYDIAFAIFDELASEPGLDEETREEFEFIAAEAEEASLQTSLTVVGWTHLTGPDSRELGAAEEAELDELDSLLTNAESDDDFDVAVGEVLTRMDACLERFPLP